MVVPCFVFRCLNTIVVTIQYNCGETRASCHMKKVVKSSVSQSNNHICYNHQTMYHQIVFVTAQWTNKTTLAKVKI